jgi:RimJ/RimL family protein N-acetyltransferase
MLLETERLRLRELVHDDAPFVLELLNDPGWLRFIGDKGVRSLDDARGYIDGRRAVYAEHGFGLWLVEPRHGGASLGLCGLVRRDGLPAADLGFAFLPAHRGSGYAGEAAAAVVDWAGRTLGMPRLLAITSPDNASSRRLLARLGFRHQGPIRIVPDEAPVELYAIDLAAASPG